MNAKTIIFLFILAISQSVWGEMSESSFCTLDETGENTVFYCKEPGVAGLHKQEVNPLIVHGLSMELRSHGVEIVTPLEFTLRVDPNQLLKDLQALNAPPAGCGTYQKVYYRVNQFNSLPSGHRIVDQLEKLADALHEAGVCDLNVKSQNFNNININTKEDLLHHFLCISNSESVFGTRNIGMGGRGPWGIHPMHNLPAGSNAFVDGGTKRLSRDGLCYPSQSVVRDSNGTEIKQSDRYLDEEVIRDNASCAMTLYKKRGGFRSWGTTNAWGSNRHCSKATRDRLQFFKHLGAKGCCTKKCRQRFTDI